MKPIVLILLPSAGVLAGWFLRPALQPAAALSPGAAEAGLAGGGPLQASATGKKGAAGTPAPVKSEVLPPINAGDPKAAIKSLLSFSRSGKNPLRTQARLLAFADQLSPADLKALALEASNQPSNYWGGDSKVKDILLGTWAEVSPKEALAFVMGPSTAATREALPAVFSQLAITDPKGAEAALGALGEGRKTAALKRELMRGEQGDPVLMKERANRLFIDGERWLAGPSIVLKDDEQSDSIGRQKCAHDIAIALSILRLDRDQRGSVETDIEDADVFLGEAEQVGDDQVDVGPLVVHVGPVMRAMRRQVRLLEEGAHGDFRKLHTDDGLCTRREV